MDVAMMQPTFLPWQGLFELIYKAQVFIFLDDFQFSIQSYHQRNRLFVNRGQADWYSVPVTQSLAPLNKTGINDSVPWRKKTWKRIDNNYSKAPYFYMIAPFVKEWLDSSFDSVATQNMSFIQHVCSLLGIEREFRLSSAFSSTAYRSQRVLELLNWCGASRYFCAHGSFSYMAEDAVFPVEHVDILFQDFKPQPYPQIGSPEQFIPFLSVLDALMNIGPEGTLNLIRTGTEKWLTWEDMKEGYCGD